MVVALGIAGLSAVYLICGYEYNDGLAFQVLAGFGFGASSIALFARVAGGIYTKAADVGADLVGKVEAGIDEDDPHNPAVIADNVGDNVGDVAGMGADLFESFVGSIIAAATLAKNDRQIALPFFLASAGIFCSMIGMMAVSTKEKGEGKNSNLSALMWALEKGMYTACFFFVIAAFVICFVLDKMYGEFACVVIGLISGALIGKVTEYFTSFDFAPVQSIKDRGKTGPATVVIQGLGVGMLSCVPPVAILVVCILACSAIKGEYGIAIAAVGMLATLGITLATDAYGPVADNAGGLAEMDPSIPGEVRDKTDALDALGEAGDADAAPEARAAARGALQAAVATAREAGCSDGDGDGELGRAAALLDALDGRGAAEAALSAALSSDALRADETLRRRYGLHAFANERYGQHCRAVLSATMAQPSQLELPRWVRVWQRVRRGTTVVLSVVVAVLSVLWARLLLF